MILADDLGYGDLSVPPFTGHGIKTPELEAMALSSVVMTNFHVAAPICTPTRASILTGLFPWRVGIYSIYGSGPQAYEHLAVVPNLPMTFLEAGYHTAHIGKWHLGGMRGSDLAGRREAYKKSKGASCQEVNPGPHQHGFVEYVAMEEGLDSYRLKTMIPKSTLYHEGAKYLVRNEEPYTKSNDILTNRQADEAIRVMNETVASGKNFFIHLWFDAPHGPWEIIEPYNKWYSPTKWEGANSRNAKYATMVSSMDANIGRVRRAIQDMGIAENTLIVFLSDNGPEEMAGSAGPFKGRKRSLYEGGIRVPCIWEWKGRLTPGKKIDAFGLSTDLFPTFLDAAGLTKPPRIKIDGTSLLAILEGKSFRKGDERLVTWHKDIGGKAGAAWSHGYKLVKVGNEPQVFFDMRLDDKENSPINIATDVSAASSTAITSFSMPSDVEGGAGGGGGVGSSSNTATSHRADPSHLSKVQAFLVEKLALFVAHGNKPVRVHKETRACNAPNASSVLELFWSECVPEF